MSAGRDWHAILVRAADIVRSYDTLVTLRQLFYRLVAAHLIRNTRSEYNQLSDRTSRAREAGWFPSLLDQTRSIVRAASWDSPQDGMAALIAQYRRNRTDGQPYTVYLGVEKATMTQQLDAWFGDLGMPIVALRGYTSTSFVEIIKQDQAAQERPAVLVYAGDYDPSGMDIDRDFTSRAGCFDEVVRIAVLPEHIARYSLVPAPGKETDTRAGGFMEKYGELVQVELEAMDPDDLHGLYQTVVDRVFDKPTYDAVLAEEADDVAWLEARRT